MAYNKVEMANGVVFIDLTSDTVTPDKLKTGITAHDKSGAVITGTMLAAESTALISEDYDINGAIIKNITTVGTIPFEISEIVAEGGGTIKTIEADNVVKLQAKTVTMTETPSTVIADSGYDGMYKLVTNANLQEKQVSITTNPMTITPDTGYVGLSEVVANAYLQEKTVEISERPTVITQDEGYVGLSKVTVDASPNLLNLEEKTITISEAVTTVTPGEGYDAISEVTINDQTPVGHINAVLKNGTRLNDLEWTVPSNATLRLNYLNCVKNVTVHGGGSIPNNNGLNVDITGIVSLPDLTTIGISCWTNSNIAATCIYIPKVTSIGNNFMTAGSVANLVKMVVGRSPFVNTSSKGSMRGTTGLKALVLKVSSVPSLGALSALTNCGLRKLSDAYIYVPRALKSDFEAATNWSVFQYRAIEDYPLIDAPDTWLPPEPEPEE